MKSSSIPFSGNPDNTHCFQCVLKMIREHDFPDQGLTWEELDEFTGKKPGLWTWATRGLVGMKELGYEVINWRKFDYQRFAEFGGEYLIERYGPEKGQAQIEHCELSYEMENAGQLGAVVQTRQSLPTWEDMGTLVNQDYLIVCNVNSKALNRKPGYSGHFVLIYEVNDESVEMHDPGPPPQESRRVLRDNFIKAWEYPSSIERNLMAFKFIGENAT